MMHLQAPTSRIDLGWSIGLAKVAAAILRLKECKE
jgi:hypothetical protein